MVFSLGEIDENKSYNKTGYATLMDGSEIEIPATYKIAFLGVFKG